jgi:hypothetical protein
MATREQRPKDWIRQMALASFSIRPDGILVYNDPMLGAFEGQRGIQVRVDTATANVHVIASGRIVRSFSLVDQEAGDACIAAAREYFHLIQGAAMPLTQVA